VPLLVAGTRSTRCTPHNFCATPNRPCRSHLVLPQTTTPPYGGQTNPRESLDACLHGTKQRHAPNSDRHGEDPEGCGIVDKNYYDQLNETTRGPLPPEGQKGVIQFVTAHTPRCDTKLDTKHSATTGETTHNTHTTQHPGNCGLLFFSVPVRIIK
jgi:hypothetical protein